MVDTCKLDYLRELFENSDRKHTRRIIIIKCDQGQIAQLEIDDNLRRGIVSISCKLLMNCIVGRDTFVKMARDWVFPIDYSMNSYRGIAVMEKKEPNFQFMRSL